MPFSFRHRLLVVDVPLSALISALVPPSYRSSIQTAIDTIRYVLEVVGKRQGKAVWRYRIHVRVGMKACNTPQTNLQLQQARDGKAVADAAPGCICTSFIPCRPVF